MKLTQAEWQIMKALWKKHPANARQIMARLPKGVSWAYTTIKTMLTRLADKQVVAETKKGSIGVYQPILTRNNARRNALASLANQAFDGAFGPLMHFLLEDQKVTPKQKRELMEALKKDSNKRQGGKK